MKRSVFVLLSVLLILATVLPLAGCNSDGGAGVPADSSEDFIYNSISVSASQNFSSSAFGSVSASASAELSVSASLGAASSADSSSSSAIGGDEPVEDVPGPDGALLVYDGTKYCVALVKPASLPADIERLITSLSVKFDLIIQPKKGLFPVKNDNTSLAAGMAEIVIGGANRPLNTSVESKLGVACAYEYRISETGGYIIGTIGAYTKDGIQAFVNDYLEKNLVEVGGKWYLLPTEKKYVNSNPSFIDIAVLSQKKGKTFSYTSATQCSIPGFSGYNVAQGATIDPTGTYLYVSMITSADKSALGKYKLDGTKVKTVTATGTDHSNDMAYNSKDNTIIVAHNTNNQKRVTVFDTNLTKKGSYDTPASLNGIGYNPEANIYAAGISGGSNFYALNDQFLMAANMGGGGKMVDTGEERTRQGMDCDADYVYFVQSAGTKSGNIILVYDWSGNHLCTINLSKNSGYEAETVIYANGKFYLWCYKGGGNGGILYRLTATMPK